VADPLLLATDLADYLVTNGVPFRKAHHIVGSLVARAEETGKPLDRLPDEDVETLLEMAAERREPLNMFTEEDLPALEKAMRGGWRKVFNLGRAIKAREKTGMPGAKQVCGRVSYWRKRLK